MILICCDSFKDALSAPSVCKAIASGLHEAGISDEIQLFPLSDGGDGLEQILDFHLKLSSIPVQTSDPIGRIISTEIKYDPERHIAFIAMAQAAGLELLTPEERNPLHTSTHGVGSLIRSCVKAGATRIFVGLGGSATNDCGTGMAQELGWSFKDENGEELKMTGEMLSRIYKFYPPQNDLVHGIDIHFMYDVDNPLLGSNGAVLTYAEQKGAGIKEKIILESGSAMFALLTRALLGINVENLPGAGAAGGMGAGGVAFLNAQLGSGTDTLLDLANFTDALDSATLVITGEGKIDAQTAHGKLIHGIAKRAKARSVPVVAFSGRLSASTEQLSEMGIDHAIEISHGIKDNSTAIEKTQELLVAKAKEYAPEIMQLRNK